MNKELKIFSLLFFLISSASFAFSQSRLELNFNAGWQFRNQEDIHEQGTPSDKDYNFSGWETVSLPHTAKIEPLVVKKPWEGISWYKKDFVLKPEWKGQKVLVKFEAVMQQADVWINGKWITRHTGGYLPFVVDITNYVNEKGTNRIVVRSDNHDDPEIPPGKPIADLDFCYFSGIYRNVYLQLVSPLHITDAVAENLIASGGVKVWYPEVSSEKASVATEVHLKNENPVAEEFLLEYILTDKKGEKIISKTSHPYQLQAGKSVSVKNEFEVEKPALWHPAHPDLYTLTINVQQNGIVRDVQSMRIGIRKFELRGDKFYINGQPLLLVGTNRHQEYPYIGNALSDRAQYRDALKIKQAGFNIVRLSHYPQSPAFMDACDELGLLTMDAIPGWQFVGNDQFREHSYQDARDLIRRDRNHACVAMWELSLNESPMPDEFMKKMTEIAKEEFPETKLITCGWIDRYYDVFIPARQHAKAPDYWKNYTGKIALFTGEYGDWEYFAQDAGLNQAGYAGLAPDERTSRQLRADGEKRLLQQATNFQEAHNDNLRSPHLGDANWLMFDYNRGYSPDIESSGIMDIFRLPKFAYYFYRSQSLPTLKIATYWDEKSNAGKVKVYSDCDEVELKLNGKSRGKQKPTIDASSDHLVHPPFVFNLGEFQNAKLEAIGYKNGVAVAQDQVTTAGKAYKLKLWYDESGKKLKADGADAVFVYAEICDKNGNILPESDLDIEFTVKGNARIIGPTTVKAEAGIATVLFQAGTKGGKINIEANAIGVKKKGLLKVKLINDK